jgi:HEAT repeat protein
MSLLLLLAGVASALALLSLAGMLALILARGARTLMLASVNRSRREILALLRSPRVASSRLRVHVARAARHDALAPIILEVLDVVGGGARAEFLSHLVDADAAVWLRRSLTRGRVACRVRAIEALSALHARESASALQRAWGDRNPRVRFAALHASITTGARPTFDHIVELALAADASQKVRALTLLERAAAWYGHAGAHALLRNDLPACVRAALATGLGDGRRMASAEVLLVTAMDQDATVRAAAVDALAALGAPRGFATITRALNDVAWPVRARAAAAVGKLRLASAHAAISALMDDEAVQVRLSAARSLAALPALAQTRAFA